MEHESRPQTLRELGGLPTRTAGVAGTAIVVIDDATATRSLPSTGSGGPIAAELVHEIALAELADRFSIVTDTDTLLAG